MRKLRRSKMIGLKQKVNSTYNSNMVKTGIPQPDLRISVGHFLLDYAFGVHPEGYAGIPIGKATCLVGGESSGKTTLALKAVANAQRTCSNCYRPAKNVQLAYEPPGEDADEGDEYAYDPETGEVICTLIGDCDCYNLGRWVPVEPKFTGTAGEKKTQKAEWAAYIEELKVSSFEPMQILYADIEGTLDLAWAEDCGVITEVLDVLRADTGERAIDVIDEYAKSGAVDMVVVDSMPELVPQVERDESVEDMQRAAQARLINKFTRKLTATSNEVANMEDPTLITFICIQQWRSGMGAFAGRVMPGGNAQKFFYAVTMDIYQNEKEKADVSALGGSSKGGATAGSTARMNLVCVKNKTWTQQVNTSAKIVLAVKDGMTRATFIEDKLFDALVRKGLIDKRMKNIEFDGQIFKTQKAVKEYLAKNPDREEWAKIMLFRKLYADTTGRDIYKDPK